MQKKKRICITTRVIPPLAAAPATERSERVGEEAEESQMQALCTYAPVPVSACVLFIGCAVFTLDIHQIPVQNAALDGMSLMR